MGYYDFQKDLDFGDKGEEFICEYLQNNGLKLINTNKDYKYDLKMLKNNEEVKYEVKTDDKISKITDTKRNCKEASKICKIFPKTIISRIIIFFIKPS